MIEVLSPAHAKGDKGLSNFKFGAFIGRFLSDNATSMAVKGLTRVAVPQVVQKTKSFPFGTAVNARKYNGNAAGGRYRDFIHQHFNWAVPKAALKWPAIERQRVRL